MIRGLYTAAAGMLSGLLRQESISQNLANVRTIGYKADRITLTDFPSLLLEQVQGLQSGPQVGRAGTGVSLASITTDFSDGAMKLTDQPFDFAIANEGFFRLQTPDGVRYTRDGRFQCDAEGRLIDANGYYVIGLTGPITLPTTSELVNVTQQGDIYVDDMWYAAFSLARFDNVDELVKADDTTFVSRNDQQPKLIDPERAQIYQGYLEESNVDASRQITEMMSVLRAYQVSQRLVSFQDQINSQSANELGRV